MAKQQTFQGTTDILDGNEYEQCQFIDCTLVYQGGSLPRIQGCFFNSPIFKFEEAASRTVDFMRAIYHGVDIGPQLIEKTFDDIRGASQRPTP